MGIPQEELQKFFFVLDADQDGKVAVREFNIPTLQALLNGLTEGKIFEKFQDSGSISFEELKQLVKDAGNLNE